MLSGKLKYLSEYFDLLDKEGKDLEWYGETFNYLYDLSENVLCQLLIGLKKSKQR
jgi:hypothetical protein